MKKNKYLVLVLMAGLLTGCQNKDAQDTLAQTGNAQVAQEEQIAQDTEAEVNNEVDDSKTTDATKTEEAKTEDTKTEDAATQNVAAGNTDTATTTQTPATTETPATGDAPAEQAKPETKTVEQISLDGLSTESKGWGQGGGVDERNVPVGCNMFQEKYGYLGADFVRTDSDAIYLTFDEGYEYPEANSPTGNTAKILDTLKAKGVKGLFFVTLPYAKSNPDLIKRMIDEGHVIGNHSVNHPSKGLPSLGSVEAQQSELTGVDDYMLKTYNYKMDLFRYPTGAFSEQSLAIVHNLGYKSVFWSFAYKDWLTDAQPDKTEALNTMKAKLHPGAIYLLHAVSETNTEVLGDFIDAAKAAGYEIKSYE
jgi:delta-lactam-biosynthetic de-N-acetylase